MSKLSKPDLAIIILAIVYILFPVDFIPELITGPIGLTDDLAAMAVIMAVFMRAREKENTTVIPATVTHDSYDYKK